MYIWPLSGGDQSVNLSPGGQIVVFNLRDLMSDYHHHNIVQIGPELSFIHLAMVSNDQIINIKLSNNLNTSY